MGLQLCDAPDAVLLREYKLSIKRLDALDPSLPKGWRDIRIMYHDYLGQELAQRRLLSLKTESQAQTPRV